MTAPLDSARAAWAAVPEEAKRRVRAVLNTSRLLSSFLADEAAYRAAVAVLEAAATPQPRTITIPEARAMALSTLARCEAARTEEPRVICDDGQPVTLIGPSPNANPLVDAQGKVLPPSGAGTDGREAGR